LRVFEPTTRIAAKWKEYASEAELFSDAIRLNGQHGRRLSKVDYIRCVQIAGRHGLEIDTVASLVGMTTEKLGKLVTDRTGWAVTTDDEGNEVRTPVILPPDCTDRAGKRLTKLQARAAKKGGTNKASFYANRLALLLEADVLDLSHGRLRAALIRLKKALDKVDLSD